jgi:monoamine oxidase
MILGGGIAGLYSGYLLTKKNPDIHLTIIEKSNRWGGRVFTYTSPTMKVEAGAGRFSNRHTRLLSLINDFKMNHLIVPITNDSEYSSPSPYKLETTLLKVIALYEVDIITDFTKITFLEYASKMLNKKEVQFIEDAFGYYAELVLMNAKDCIRLMIELNFSKFYILKGGLSQLIDKLVEHLLYFPNVSLHLNEEVISIKKGIVETTKRIYHVPFCICALPKQVLETFTISKPIRNKLKHIHCAPLCRIYASFSKNWYKGGKLRCKSPLRMIIPGKTLMISYSDHKYALFWRDVEKKGKVVEVLRHLIKEELNIWMPEPLEVKVCFWDCGVGYWGKVDSQVVSQQLVNPFPGFYICGEHYSSQHQQWIEGALETSERVINHIYNQPV